jgi:hypothetical protein
MDDVDSFHHPFLM